MPVPQIYSCYRIDLPAGCGLQTIPRFVFLLLHIGPQLVGLGQQALFVTIPGVERVYAFATGVAVVKQVKLVVYDFKGLRIDGDLFAIAHRQSTIAVVLRQVMVRVSFKFCLILFTRELIRHTAVHRRYSGIALYGLTGCKVRHKVITTDSQTVAIDRIDLRKNRNSASDNKNKLLK